MLPNSDVRLYAKGKGIPMWRIAQHLNISEPTLTRRFRSEMSEDTKTEMKQIIDELAQESA